MIIVYPTKGLEEEMVSSMVYIYLCSYILIDTGRRKPSRTLEFQLWPSMKTLAAAHTHNEDLWEMAVTSVSRLLLSP
jgi:hypothetical protein